MPTVEVEQTADDRERQVHSRGFDLMVATKTLVIGALALSATVTGLSISAFADDRGSMDDQLACTPDVYRLCSSLIPDEDAITACLKQHLQALSPACHKVFSRPPDPAGNDDSDGG